MLRCIKNYFLGLKLRRALAEHSRIPGELEKLRVAKLLLELSRIEEAHGFIQDGLALFPTSRRLREAREEIRRAQAIAMLKRLRPVLEEDPSAEDFIRASELSRVAGNLEEALSHAYDGMQAFPEDWRIQLALGKLYFHKYNSGRQAIDGIECLKHLNAARQLAPEEPRILFFLALGHAIQGDQREALSAIEILTSSNPQYPKALALKRRIEDGLASQAAALKHARPAGKDDSRIHAALAPLGLDPTAVREQLSSVEGMIGWFFMVEGGAVIASHVQPDPLFDLGEPKAGLEALAASCRFGSGRIGIGEMESLSLSGDGWEIHLRALGDLSLVTFLKGVSSSDVENILDRIVKPVPAACVA